jgi:hypothetical protein
MAMRRKPEARRHGTLSAAVGRRAARSTRAVVEAAHPECRLVSPCRTLLDALPSIYDDAALSDVTFVVGQRREIHAHRVVLACVSSKFRNMFTSKHELRWHEKVVPFDEYEPEPFARLLRYLYGQCVDSELTELLHSRGPAAAAAAAAAATAVTAAAVAAAAVHGCPGPLRGRQALRACLRYMCCSEVVVQGLSESFDLLLLASDFDVPDLVESVTSYLVMQVQPSNCCSVWNIARAAGVGPVLERAMHEIASCFEEVATYQDFLELEEEGLEEVMQRDDLQCTEEKVFEALLCWVSHRQQERQQALDHLLPLCRLALIDTVYLQDYVDGNEVTKSRTSQTDREADC